MSRGKILSYDELLSQYPDWTLWETETYAQESTPEATERARLHRLALIGHVIKFIQDNSLVRRTLCATAPQIPEKFSVLLRDITPEGLEFYRTGYKKWLGRFERDMYADPSDVTILQTSLIQLRAKAEGLK